MRPRQMARDLNYSAYSEAPHPLVHPIKLLSVLIRTRIRSIQDEVNDEY